MRFDIDDVIPWVFAVFFVFLVALLVFCIYCAAKEGEEIKECYMQEIKTKECEYKLWRYENRDKTHTAAVPVFIPIHH